MPHLKIILTIVSGALLVSAAIYAVNTRSGTNKAQNYIIEVKPSFGNYVQKPKLPDISHYNTQTVKNKLPQLSNDFIAEVSTMEDHYGFLPTHNLHNTYAEMQDRIEAEIIIISEGIVDLKRLYTEIDDSDYLEQTDTGYVLKVPLYVDEGATFIIEGASSALKMLSETGAFIATRGDLFVIDTEITGWNGKDNKPALYKSAKSFRPFLVFWNSSDTYIANSKIRHLGYSAPKAYGLTFSVNGGLMKQDSDLPWPTGWLVDNVFEDLYYGQYSYEAEDVAIIGNLYKDNIVYAIDPHDRSRRFIIAENETTGTKIKHGIIISRDVNDSWIFNNKSHNNAGSGIMIERNSRNNIVAFNESYENEDGIVFYESPDNVSWGNTIHSNNKNGMRIRNSWNIIIREENIYNNKSYGLEAYAASLKKHSTRDLEIDPYEPRAGFDLASSRFNNNTGGQIRINDVEAARFENLESFKIGAGFLDGDLKSKSTALYSLMTTIGSSVMIRKPDADLSLMIPAAARNTRKRKKEK